MVGGKVSVYDAVDLYDVAIAHRRRDIDYFVALAQAARGPVLEYGCGSGRVTLPLARAGAEVVGVDRSRPMLGQLKERLARLPQGAQEHVRLVRADMRRYVPERRFPLILATFNVVGHLHRESDLVRWLRLVRAALAPGGELVFDTLLPAPEEIEADPDERVALPRFRHPVSGAWVHHDERYEYDLRRQLLTVESDHWLPQKPKDRLTTRLVLRQWFPRELESLLRYEGFEARLTADYSGAPAILAEDMIVVHARKGR